jgi:hypothetical protein
LLVFSSEHLSSSKSFKICGRITVGVSFDSFEGKKKVMIKNKANFTASGALRYYRCHLCPHFNDEKSETNACQYDLVEEIKESIAL